jgi:predicted RNA-binding Zn ribbon-like protein
MKGQPGIRQPGDREVAPGPLALVQSFVNSINVEFGPDEFATVDGLAAWIDRNGLGGPQVDPGDLDVHDATTLREALRALLRENNDDPADPAAHRTVERLARDFPLVVAFDAGRIGLRPAMTDVRGAYATVLAAVAGSVADGSWPRLKACKEHRCEWIFYDRSRNQASRWCSMAVCGTRAKMRAYREGQRAQA